MPRRQQQDVERDEREENSENSGDSGDSEMAAARPSGRPRTHTRADDAASAAHGSRAATADAARMPTLPELRSKLTAQQPGRANVERMLRQQNVLALWTRGYNVSEMAETLHVTRVTIRSDIQELQKDLQREILPELHTRVNRAAAVRQAVMQEAWSLYHRLEDKSHNKVAALDTVLKAVEQLDKLTGVAAPDAVNATVVAEMQASVMDALYAVGGQQLQQEFLRRLRANATTARDFYPPDPMLPGEKKELDEFMPLPEDYVDASSEGSEGGSGE